MSPRALTAWIVFAAVGVGAGCLGEAGPNPGLAGNGGGGGGDGGGSGGGSGSGSGSGGGGVVSADAGSGGGDGGVVVLSSEFPCAAYDVLFGHCTSCHGSPLAGGAPQALNTLAALLATSPGYPGQSNGQRAVVRMASTASPMPPSGYAAVPAADQSAFSAWVTSGMPTGTCTTGGGADGGTTQDAGPPPPPDPLNAAPTCTSNSYWTRGTNGSSVMEPGWACITCHSRGDGPTFTVAGTVFPTGHEPDSCNGSDAAGAVVRVTDSTGLTASFTANSAGNFSGSPSLTFPITAQVSLNGKVRGMATAVATGDCNSCHTQTGANGAPGRITLPF